MTLKLLAPQSRDMSLSWKEAFLLSRLFGSRNPVYAAIKTTAYKLGLDVSLAHDNFWRDPEDCPECMTNEEWKSSKYRHLKRMGPEESDPINAKDGVPVPLDACYPYLCKHTRLLDYSARCDNPTCESNLCNIEGHIQPNPKA